MKDRVKLIIRVNREADKEDFYRAAQELGELAALAFREEHSRDKQNRHRAQMTGLENIAETTLKVTDVLDYIKKQTARQKGWQNSVGAHGERFGEKLKTYIEEDMKKFLDKVCGVEDDKPFITATTDEGKQARRAAYLELVRQLIRQLVVHYEYRVTQMEETAKR